MHGTMTNEKTFLKIYRMSKYNQHKTAWDKLEGLTSGGTLAIFSEKSGPVRRMQVKKQENCAGELTTSHCIIHQETLLNSLKMEHVMSTVTQTVNFIRAMGLNHKQFQSFLREIDSEFADIPYHPEVRWLS